MQVLPAHSYTFKSIYINKRERNNIEYNDDKINTVITNITSSTPISQIAIGSQYIKLGNKYSIPPKGKAVVADLDDKTVALVEDGNIYKIYRIVSVGKPNKYYETPGGIYKIKSWETNHYSSIGHVYMPWSMQFSGNYFIHGIPYYEDGEHVSSQYSGGCIRLTDEDAEGVYNFSDKNTYVVVIKKEDITADSSAERYDHTTMDEIRKSYQGNKYLIMDLKDNVYFSNVENLNKVLADTQIENIAVTMTALDNVSQEKMIFVGDDKVKQLDLLPKLLAGDKEAMSKTIDPLGWRLFQAFLNNKIKSIGLENTEINIAKDQYADAATNSATVNTSTSTLLDMMYIYRYAYIYKPYMMSLDGFKPNTNIKWQVNSNKYTIKIVKESGKDFLIISY